MDIKIFRVFPKLLYTGKFGYLIYIPTEATAPEKVFQIDLYFIVYFLATSQYFRKTFKGQCHQIFDPRFFSTKPSVLGP
jgi:hypothetical protein